MIDYKPLWYMFIALAIAAFSILYGSHLSETVDGDCFDKFGNKIQGLTCDVDKTTKEGWILFAITFPLALLFMFLAFRSLLYGVD